MRADAGVDHATVEACGLLRHIQLERILSDASRAEIVGLTADGNDQSVVFEEALWSNLVPVLIPEGGDMYPPARAVETDHLANAITELMPVRLGEVVDFMVIEVHAARRDLVQQGLPQVRP